MGAGESIQTNLWSSNFQFQSKNSKLGIIKLTDKQNEDSYICRKLSLMDKKQIQQIDRLIDIKLSIQSPYVVKLQKATCQKNQQYCAYGKNYFLLFKNPYQTLKQQTLNRKFKNSLYSENQLEMMLQIGVKGLYFLKNIDHPHENISSTAFFINENRSMILGDPFMFSREIQPPRVRNGFIYPSPQLIKCQNHEIEEYDKHLSDLFTFGLVLLEVFQITNMDSVYEKYFQRINHQAINKKLSKFKNQQLRKKLFILLDPQPKNRQIVFKYYVKSIPATDTFNKLQKQKFKKTIDRYNLATSQVTEWKNDPTLENRLSSSEEKRTFSVSTNQNQNQQKNKNYHDKQPQFNRPDFSQTSNLKRLNHKKSQNGEQNMGKASTVSYQAEKYEQSRLNFNPPSIFNKPLQAYQSIYRPLQTPQSTFLPHFQNSSQVNFNHSIYKPQKIINFQPHSPINYLQPSFQTQSYSTGITYQPPNKKYFQSDLNILQREKNTFTRPNNKLNSFQFTPSYLPLRQNKKQSFCVQNQINKKTTESLNFSSDKNETLLSIAQQSSKILTSPQIQNPLKFQDNSHSIRVHQIQTQNQISRNQSQVILGESTKIDKATPGRQKIKRISLDYGKYHNLSTINQRSEMNESFISETYEKKSDILIQQDEQVIQTLRDCQSQQDEVKNSHIEENKIWSITYPSGTKYMGEVRNDKRNGLGTFFYIDGSKYHGHWLDNKMNGFGTLFYPNGKVAYQGEWKLDNFHGKGKVFNDQIDLFDQSYNYQNCTDIENYWLEYDGQLSEDRKEGKGTLKLANGEYFQAEFKNDELHGHCKFYSRENKIIEGLWENNKLVEVISQKEKL